MFVSWFKYRKGVPSRLEAVGSVFEQKTGEKDVKVIDLLHGRLRGVTNLKMPTLIDAAVEIVKKIEELNKKVNLNKENVDK